MRQAFFTPNSILRSRQPRDSVFSRGSERWWNTKWIRHFGGLLDMGDDSGNKLPAARSEVGGVLWSSQLSGGIRLLWENQCVLKSVGSGADHVPSHRKVLADVEVKLNAVGPLGIVGDGVSVTGHLFATAGL